ncbi:hypothetical protein JX266_009137 [Neoarthrinium moseri]|nr:hypothetical protein JX266_009137 [Neoarthrinium moseri]
MLALAGRNGTRAVVLLMESWQDTGNDESPMARSLDAYDPHLYLNYAAPCEDAIASYGTNSIQHLQALRSWVDPTAVFTRRVPEMFRVL